MSPLLTWPIWAKLGIAIGLGALAALGLAPWGYWPLTVAALAAVPFLLGAVLHPGAGFAIGWAFGTGYFALALMWIIEPFFVDAARHAWMAPFALALMSGGMAVFWGIAFWGAVRLARVAGGRVTALVCTLSLAEFARAHLLSGFPWGAPGQVWVGTNAAQLLAWVGPQGLNFFTFLGALPLGLTLLPASSRRAMLTGLVPALALVGMAQIKGAPPKGIEMTGHRVRLVQPNAPQHQKWNPAYMPVFFRRQIDYTSAEPRPDLVVWPEAALAHYTGERRDPFEVIAEAAKGAPVIFGLLREDRDGFFNSALALDSLGEVVGTYDKHHLVPFGEYIPAAWVFERLGLQAIATAISGDMLAGPGPGLLDLGRLGRTAPMICYEAVFPRNVPRGKDRPDWLLQITNDAWFGAHSGPYQHLAQAQMRSIEQGLPMVRVANTGVSAMIDPYGRISAQIPLGRAGYTDAALPAPLKPTYYSKTGDWPIFWLLISATLAFAGRNAIKKRLRRD